ncbi:MAG: PIN domain-containing protein, partial [Treponema sp.]|nr:PIN domain-containing protein [Treponema sp.]
MAMNVFFDTDIILDIATARIPFCEPAAKVFSIIENGNIRGYTSATIFINVFYMLRKLIGKEKALSFLKDLEQILTVLPTDKDMIHNALYSTFSDFEDATQYFTALQIPVDYILTRNLADYKESVIPIKTPKDFLD